MHRSQKSRLIAWAGLAFTVVVIGFLRLPAQDDHPSWAERAKVGKVNHDLDATGVIWEFFSRHRRE